VGGSVNGGRSEGLIPEDDDEPPPLVPDDCVSVCGFVKFRSVGSSPAIVSAPGDFFWRN